uniref:Uncharacterized protein n=1 Tax=Lepeophtheirus salmonis TaxID=72036 RepID=A0A0K2V5X9_LEPSM
MNPLVVGSLKKDVQFRSFSLPK